MNRTETVVRGGRRPPVFTILAVVAIGAGAALLHFTPTETTELAGAPVETPAAPAAEQPVSVESEAKNEESTPPPHTVALERAAEAAPASVEAPETSITAPLAAPSTTAPETAPVQIPAPQPGAMAATAAASPADRSGDRVVVTPQRPAKDPKALTPFERVQADASAGDPAAQYTLGVALLEGNDTPTDRPRALAWFMQSAARGNAQAVEARDRLFAAMDDGERVRGESLSRSLESPMPAGWLDVGGVRVWAPSWYRNGTWTVTMKVQAENGLAQGAGEVHLKANLYGRSSRGYEGRFVKGLLLDEALTGKTLDLLETDAYRVHVPVRSEDAGSLRAIWMQNSLNGLTITACPRHSPDLYAVLTADFPVLDDEAVTDAARKVAQTVATLCPLDPRGGANVTLLPAEHAPVLVKGDTAYAPVLAEVYLGAFERDVKDWSTRLTNLARRDHERAQHEAQEAAKKVERERQREREVAAALARPMPVIRNLTLGMTLAQVHDTLGGEATQWDPHWKPDRELRPFAHFKQSITLDDRSTLNATFSSAENGHRLLALGFEQRLREGPSFDALRAHLGERFGEPDNETGNGSWLTWWLTSETGKPKGAFLRARIQGDRASGRVSMLRLVLTDSELMRKDERQAYDARLAAKRREYDESKSDQVKF